MVRSIEYASRSIGARSQPQPRVIRHCLGLIAPCTPTMIAQVLIPIRLALIPSFAFFACLVIFIPYTPSRPNFSFTKRQAHNPTATETCRRIFSSQSASHNANQPPTEWLLDSTPEAARIIFFGNLTDDPIEAGYQITTGYHDISRHTHVTTLIFRVVLFRGL